MQQFEDAGSSPPTAKDILYAIVTEFDRLIHPINGGGRGLSTASSPQIDLKLLADHAVPAQQARHPVHKAARRGARK
jgi:hypothetical protein